MAKISVQELDQWHVRHLKERLDEAQKRIVELEDLLALAGGTEERPHTQAKDVTKEKV